MKRGEIWEYLPPNGGPTRVVVLSADAHNDNPAHWPVCALVVRRPAVAHPYRAPLADVDPLGGAVDVATIGPLNPARMRGPAGMLTGATVARVGEALRAFLEL